MSRLAPKYGISDVGLKKICKKLNVPTPPLGYWTKIQHNIRVEKTPLPRLKHGELQIHTIQKSELNSKDNFEFSEEAKEDLKRWHYASFENYDYKPSGKLTLQIDSWSAAGIRKRWSDGKIQRVENFLTDFTINVVKMADMKRADRIEREERWRLQEEERRKQAEMVRLRQIEEERLRDLENQATLWFKSNHLRNYIRAVQTAALERGCSIEDEPLKSWLKWANGHANSFDPLFDNLPFENKK